MKILKSRKEYKLRAKEFNKSSVCFFCEPKKELVIKAWGGGRGFSLNFRILNITL